MLIKALLMVRRPRWFQFHVLSFCHSIDLYSLMQLSVRYLLDGNAMLSMSRGSGLLEKGVSSMTS